jgi:predicted membrane channel-forming protein YqfA (hemolysin III family)
MSIALAIGMPHWHLFVLGGTVSHYAAIAGFVV